MLIKISIIEIFFDLEKGNIKKAINHIDLMLEHYKHADSTLIKVNRAKALKEELNKQL